MGEETEFLGNLERYGHTCGQYTYSFFPSADEIYIRAKAYECTRDMAAEDCWAQITTEEVEEELAWLWATDEGGNPVAPYLLLANARFVEPEATTHIWSTPAARYTAREEWLATANCFPFACVQAASVPNGLQDDWGPHDRQRRNAELPTKGAPTAVRVTPLKEPKTWHVTVGETAANQKYKDLPFEMPTAPIDEGFEFLRDSLNHNVRELFKGRKVPDPFDWREDGMDAKRKSILRQRDQLITEMRRWTTFGLSARGTHKDHLNKETLRQMVQAEEQRWRNRRNKREVPEPLNVVWRSVCEFCSTEHPPEAERFRKLLRPPRGVTTAVGALALVTAARHIMGLLSKDQVSAMHRKLGQLRTLAKGMFGDLGTMGGTVENLARLNEKLFRGLSRGRAAHEWDVLWTAHFREVLEAARVHMEVVATAASQALHPALLTQTNLGQVAKELQEEKEKTGYVASLESPLQWLTLPASFSSHQTVRETEDGEPRVMYDGARVIVRLPLEKPETRMVMLQQVDAPVASVYNAAHLRVGPRVDRTLVVGKYGTSDKKEWTTLTPSELARCRRMGQFHTCPSIGAFRKPMEDSAKFQDDDEACIYAIWRGHSNMQGAACEFRQVTEEITAQKVGSHRFVVYSEKPVDFAVECDTQGHHGVTSEKIEKLALLELPPGCKASGKHLTLWSDSASSASQADILHSAAMGDGLRRGLRIAASRAREAEAWSTEEQNLTAEAAVEWGRARLTNRRIRAEIRQLNRDAAQDEAHGTTWSWVLGNVLLTALLLVVALGACILGTRAMRKSGKFRTWAANLEIGGTLSDRIWGTRQNNDNNDTELRFMGLRKLQEHIELCHGRIIAMHDVCRAMTMADRNDEVVMKARDVLANVAKDTSEGRPGAVQILAEKRAAGALRENLEILEAKQKWRNAGEIGGGRVTTGAPPTRKMLRGPRGDGSEGRGGT